MKEKFDLSLDNRQIVSLLIGGIVVLGAVFVLGVVVGKKLAGNQKTAEAPDLLTALDQKAEVPLTFQDELTKKAPQAASPPVVTAPAPVAVVKPEPAGEKQEKPEPVKAEAAPAPKADVVVAVAKAEPEKTTLPAVSGKIEDDQVATNTKESGLKTAFARVAKPTEAKTGGAWTVQLSASQSKDEADKFAARVRDHGYAPFIVRAEVPGRGTWYRVRMGSFPTKDAASRYLADFKRETKLNAFVTGNN